MANQRPLIVRNRPDVAGTWSPQEIARQWLRWCPPDQPGTREFAEPPDTVHPDAILNNFSRVQPL
jgi:hypothetical protein